MGPTFATAHRHVDLAHLSHRPPLERTQYLGGFTLVACSSANRIHQLREILLRDLTAGRVLQLISIRSAEYTGCPAFPSRRQDRSRALNQRGIQSHLPGDRLDLSQRQPLAGANSTRELLQLERSAQDDRELLVGVAAFAIADDDPLSLNATHNRPFPSTQTHHLHDNRQPPKARHRAEIDQPRFGR